MIDLEKRRESMARRLEFLERKLHGIEEELESRHTPDWEESAQEREADEVLEGVGLAGQQEIRMIKAALERMDAGEYGICVKCGNPISEDRLEVLPFTPFCRTCAV